MTNRILHIELRDRSVVPAEAEVLVVVVPERLDAATEVRGRLMGPRCRYAGTIEVAYPFRPIHLPTGRPAITRRVLIPEANLWDPQSPHLYCGPVELWQDGRLCETVEVRHGLRHFSVGPRGLRVNGRVTRLRGKAVRTVDEETAATLRAAGYNLLVAPVAGDAVVWEVADRIGFVVVGRVAAGTPADRLRQLAGHPSCLGWLLDDNADIGEPPAGTLLGTTPAHPAAGRAGFLIVAGDVAVSRPRLLLGSAGAVESDLGAVEGGESV